MTDLANWTPRPTPGLATLEGARVHLEPLDWESHGVGLFAAVAGVNNEDLWRWMPVGPFPTPDSLRDFLAAAHAGEGWRTMVIRQQPISPAAKPLGQADILGMATYMRIREAHGSAEIGCVAFGPRLARTAAATEALTLMAGHVFDLGYRRYEWKANAANAPSRRSAERFGYAFEGTFRNDMVMKGKSRDTVWYSITDDEWPRIRTALGHWLAHDNFATDGAQRRTLESFRQ